MKQSKKAKYSFYLVGILILTLGVSFTIQSNLGTSPFDSLLVGLSRNVGLTVGSWEILLSLIVLIINSLLRRQKPEVLGLLTALITGIGIDMWLYLLHNLITPHLWFSKLICIILGLFVTGLGTAFYLQTHFALTPIDRFTFIIQELMRTNLFISKTLIYLLFLILAIIFNGPIGIGTLLTICLGGLLLNFFMPFTERLGDFLFVNSSKTAKYEADKNHSI